MTPPRVRRTTTTLADGRELIYFDDSEPYLSGAQSREVVDERPLNGRPTAGTMRLDALTGEWVSIADHRQNRTFLPPTDECPLCPSGGGTMPSEIPAHEYDVVVFENRFPSFASGPTAAGTGATGTSAAGSSAAGLSGSSLLAQAPALGRCEVVCFTSDHDASFSSLSPARARTVVDVWADRTRELSAIDAVEHVFCFENRGEEIGVTLHHPHGQIYAYPFVPARTESLLRAATEHHQRTGRLLGADILAAELEAGSRVVIRGTAWTAYVPYAARWPVEVNLVPNRDVPDLVALDGDERDELAGALATTKEPKHYQQLLSLLTTDTVRRQDLMHWYVWLLRNRYARSDTWQWLISHWDWIDTAMSSEKTYAYFPRYAGSIFSRPDQLKQFRAFFDPLKDVVALNREISLAEQEITSRIAWRERNETAVKAWLKQLPS